MFNLPTIITSNTFYTLGFGLILAICSAVVLNFILKKITQKIQKSKNTWDDLILASIKPPIQLLLWYVWLYYTIFVLIDDLPWLSILKYPLNIAPLLLTIWAFFRLVDRIALQLNSSKASVDADSIYLITRLVKILLIIITVLMVAQHLGLSVASILTFGGMGGVIIGFAAKDMLANIFGGLMLQIDKPFSTGDWIRSDEKGFEGVVEKIGWRMTKIITFSKNPVYIPNSIFATIHVETPSRMTNRRIKTTIGIRYDDINIVATITNDIKNYFNGNDDIDKNKIIIVNLNEFNAYSVDFLIYAFTKTTDWQKFHNIKQGVLLDINQIITKHGGEIAFPTQVLNISKDE